MIMNWVSIFLLLLMPVAQTAATKEDATAPSVDIDGSDEDVKHKAAAVFAESLVEHHESQQRNLQSYCFGPTETYYFEVEIRLVPDENTGICNIADQVLLGNDINQLLLDYGIGQSGADDGAIFLAGVCPTPTTERRRRQLRSSNGFMWRGGGGCRFCFVDNFDNRALMSGGNWFTDTFAPSMEPTLETAIRSRIVPNHQHCLGINPVIDVNLIQVSLQDLNIQCEDGRIIETLESLSIGDLPLQRNNCDNCVSLDFSQSPDGTVLQKGDWIKSQWHVSHGLQISATGGYSPLFQARIFDTADAVCVNVDGSRDFGSPNQSCKNGGQGVGEGGEAGADGENCDPVGNVLVVQESDKECPDSNVMGGAIVFQWDSPVLLSDIGLMDVDEANQRIRIHYADGYFETFAYNGFGDNAVQRVVASKLNVIKVEVLFSGTGAVTEIHFCPDCRPLEGQHYQQDHHCLYTQDETQIKAQEVVYFDDFETYHSSSSTKRWENGKTVTQIASTTMLGTYTTSDEALQQPFKIFYVPRTPDGIIVELDFYQIGSWESGGDDKALIFMDGERIDLGLLNSVGEGTTSIGISWSREAVETNDSDVFNSPGGQAWTRHRVRVVVPESSGLYGDGKLRVTLQAQFEASGADASRAAGWDNVKVTIIHKCHERAQLETFADTFATPGFLGGNDGTVDWSDPWSQESGVYTSSSTNWCKSGNCLRLLSSASNTVKTERHANLSGFASGTLSFDYRVNHGASVGEARVRVLTNDDSYTLGTIPGGGKFGSSQFIIPAAFLTADFRLQFRAEGLTDAFLDNVLLTVQSSSSVISSSAISQHAPAPTPQPVPTPQPAPTPPGTQTLADNFDSGLSGSDGAVSWSAPWSQGTGVLTASSNVWCRSGGCLRLYSNSAGGTVMSDRGADLSTFSSDGTLSFDYRVSYNGSGGEEAMVQIVTSGNTHTLGNIPGYQVAGSAQYTIPASYLTADFRVQFRAEGKIDAYIDNVVLTLTN